MRMIGGDVQMFLLMKIGCLFTAIATGCGTTHRGLRIRQANTHNAADERPQ